jgi:hypothetical protein
MDKAANLFEVLAWSFSLKSVLRTANISDVSPDSKGIKTGRCKRMPVKLVEMGFTGIFFRPCWIAYISGT